MTPKINQVTTNGKTWSAYYSDKTAWPKGSYHDDSVISVNGDENADLDIVPYAAAIVISDGVVIFIDGDSQDLCKHFSTWPIR